MPMVLKIKPSADVVVPVEVPGEAEPVELTATWDLLKVDEAKQAYEASPEEVVRQHLKDLQGITDEDGTERPFDDNVREEAMQIPYVRTALIQSFFQTQSGRAQYATKN